MMSNYLEETAQTLLLSITGDIAVVERVGSTVNYYTSSSNPQGIYSIVYGSDAEAQAAVDAFLLAANPPSVINAGDIVVIHPSLGNEERTWGSTINAEVIHAKDPKEPYWVFKNLDTDVIFCWDSPIRMKIQP